MSHQHGHHHGELKGKNLFISIVMNFVITAAQVVGGILSNSLALLSDALHNFSDGLALVIAYIAHRIGKKESNYKNTFGYKRIEILAAFINSIILIVISIYLFYEAVQRFLNPEPINGSLMFIIATIGLIANIIAVFLLQKDSKHSLNIKAAYLHLIGDTVSSVAVIAGSIMIYFWEMYWVDPVLTFIIGIYILKETYGILKETIDILMQAAPDNIEISDIQDKLLILEDIRNIHHVHIWKLSDHEIHFESHIELKENLTIKDTDTLISKIEQILHDNFDIHHVTVQFEYDPKCNKNLIHSANH